MNADTRSLIERMQAALDCVNEDVDAGGHADACDWRSHAAEARFPDDCQYCRDLVTAEELAREAERMLGEGGQ